MIELLTVIAIIGILAGITFGITKGVNERAAINQAKAELAALSVALENYKRQYGDYPQTNRIAATEITATLNETSVSGKFFNSLAGKLGPKGDPIDGRSFVELGKFTLETANLPTSGNTISVANAFLDPWGKRYLYSYKNSSSPGTWKNPSYILFSAGPNGTFTQPGTNGDLPTASDDKNADNIYANE
ncbi:hypothetical protein [Geminisphaera colitermitum]|uniref:hypothetical protein n=1 Tax=Geminisphaera colitermitum TaxID=1148786 RepID=UPI000310A407|nr:hypothetical protein [Geminisphaera colitermitum]